MKKDKLDQYNRRTTSIFLKVWKVYNFNGFITYYRGLWGLCSVIATFNKVYIRESIGFCGGLEFIPVVYFLDKTINDHDFSVL